MENFQITFLRINDNNLPIPKFETPGSAGMDIKAHLSKNITLEPGEWQVIPTGFQVEIPENFELQVRPRSGLAIKHGITVFNAPGTIDSDYRGEIGVILINLGKEPYTIENGDRVAQLVLSKIYRAKIIETKTLSSSERGSNGFGSTGK